MSDAVLVTGAFGLVGSATVKHLAAAGRHVVATDLDTPANRKAAAALPRGVTVRWTDLTDPKAVGTLMSSVAPASIIHLAAVIPPLCFVNPAVARKVNVEATSTLVNAAAAEPKPPRFVQASSIAVYGPRNPHRTTELLTADTPVRPFDIYGGHKVEAEHIVRGSAVDFVILRLGGVMSTEFDVGMSQDMLYFEGLLPTDGRLQTVDVRDVAHAFVAATTADVIGQTLLIGGDDSHRQVQGEVAAAITAAMGLGRGDRQGPQGKSGRRRCLVCHRLDGFHQIPRAAGLSALHLAGDPQGDRRPDRLEASTVPGGRAAGPRVPQATVPVLQAARQVRRPVGCGEAQVGPIRGGQGMSARVAVIVGGASGIGWATAQKLAAEGYRVTIADRNTDLASQRAAELAEPHTWAQVEVTDEATVAKLFDDVVAREGGLHAVVNCAGFSGFGVITELDAEQFRSVIDVCLNGAFLVIKHAGRHLRRGWHAGVADVVERAAAGDRHERVLLGEGRPVDADPGGGAGTGPARNPGQRRRTRLRAHPADRRRGGDPRGGRGVRREHRAGPGRGRRRTSPRRWCSCAHRSRRG